MGSRLARVFTIALGCLAVAWGAMTLPIFWREAGRNEVAARIVQGHRYATAVLTEQISEYESTNRSFCRAPALRSAAVIRLKLVDNALAEADRISLDGRVADLKRSIIDLFACDPNDSFFWMVYYWINLTEDGFNPNFFKFLLMSYRQGPNEGWIAVKRNRLAIAVFPQLTPELSDLAIKEFVGIVRSGFSDEAAAILTEPGWPIRSELLSRLDTVAPRERERFATALRGRGYELTIPGVAPAVRKPFP